MVRAKWLGTVLAAIVSVGPVLAQNAGGSTARAEAADSLITVRGADNHEQKCKLVRTWREPDGRVGYDLQDIKSGERMTLYEEMAPAPRDNRSNGARGLAGFLFGGREQTSELVLEESVESGHPLVPVPVAAQSSPSKPSQTGDPLNATPAYRTACRTNSTNYAPTHPTTSFSDGRGEFSYGSQRSSNAAIYSANSAPPGDWRQSWGKADGLHQVASDGKIQRVSGATDAPPSQGGMGGSVATIHAQAKAEAPCPDVPCQDAVGPCGDCSSCDPCQWPEGKGLLWKLRKSLGKLNEEDPCCQSPEPDLSGTGSDNPAAKGAPGSVSAAKTGNPMEMPADWGQTNAFSPPPPAKKSRWLHWRGDKSDGDADAASAPAGNAMTAGMPQNAPGWLGQNPAPYGPGAAFGMMNRMPQPARPAMAPSNAPATLTGPSVQQLLGALRNGPYPSQREWATMVLAGAEYNQPLVVATLQSAAVNDPAATVRAACVRCLVKLHANSGPVLATLQGLRSDADARVREEATAALAILGSTAPAAAEAPSERSVTVIPAGGR